MSDLEKRLRDAYRDGLGDAWDLCQEAADTLAAVQEWAEKDPIPYAKEKALALDGTNGYIEAQVDVLDIILDRSDTDD